MDNIQSACCKSPMDGDHRYCPCCGWECCIEPCRPEDGGGVMDSLKEKLDALKEFTKQLIKDQVDLLEKTDALKELLGEAVEVVRDKVEQNPWPPEKGGFASGCQFCGKPFLQRFSNEGYHYDNCSWLKAQALLPKLKAAFKETL